MNRITTSPFQLLGNLDRFFNQALQAPVHSENPHRIFRSEKGIRIELDLPGVDKSDITLKREFRALTIESLETSDRSFSREFKISTEYDLENIEANLNNGLLRIDIPKAEEAVNAQEIEIK